MNKLKTKDVIQYLFNKNHLIMYDSYIVFDEWCGI